MITIEKGVINFIYVTFTELMETKSNWIYLVFYNETNRDNKVATILKEDQSNIPIRINRYMVTEKEDYDPNSGEIELSRGYYEYEAYEMDPLSTYEEPTLIKLVEKGRCLVSGGNPTHRVYE